MARQTQGKRPEPSVLATNVTKPVPVNWARDPLSKFLDWAASNQIATFAGKRSEYARLAAIDQCFLRVAENWTNPKNAVAALLLLRCHAAFRAAVGLSMSGQMEVYAVLRSCLEYAGYSVYISRNPKLTRVWLNRHQNDKTLKQVRQEFTVAKVRGAIAASNRHAADRFSRLYDQFIDFGAHPNERAVTGNMKIEETADRKTFLQMYLHGDGLQMDHGLIMTARCGAVALEILECAFGPLFSLLGISERLLEIRKGL